MCQAAISLFCTVISFDCAFAPRKRFPLSPSSSLSWLRLVVKHESPLVFLEHPNEHWGPLAGHLSRALYSPIATRDEGLGCILQLWISLNSLFYPLSHFCYSFKTPVIEMCYSLYKNSIFTRVWCPILLVCALLMKLVRYVWKETKAKWLEGGL